MIRVRTPSRLHFGLLSVPSASAPERRSFGGIGLMVDAPGIELTVDLAATMSADGPLAERALQFARTYCASVGVKQAFRVQITSAAPEHVGLGVGTQLGLAIAHAIARLTNEPTTDLARHVGRGARSAIGVHGFERGGFLVEGGKTPAQAISPLLARCEFPDEWSVLLILPRDLRGVYGLRERDAFADLARRDCDERLTDAMSRLILLGILPALMDRDLPAFGASLYEYNRRAGEMFRSVQNGVYAHAWIEEAIETIRALGVQGIGQSSWGPVVFAIVPREDAPKVREYLEKNTEHAQIVLTSACNHGAQCVKADEHRVNPGALSLEIHSEH